MSSISLSWGLIRGNGKVGFRALLLMVLTMVIRLSHDVILAPTVYFPPVLEDTFGFLPMALDV